jgi:hypothetical protein
MASSYQNFPTSVANWATQTNIIDAGTVITNSLVVPGLKDTEDGISFFDVEPSLQLGLGNAAEIYLDIGGGALSKDYNVLKDSIVYEYPLYGGAIGQVSEDITLVAGVDTALPVYNIQGDYFGVGSPWHLVLSPTEELIYASGVLTVGVEAYQRCLSDLREYGLLSTEPQ